jgi:hypothetical protein
MDLLKIKNWSVMEELEKVAEVERLDEFENFEEEWFTLDDIELSQEPAKKLYCIAVASPDKQFLAGHIGVPTHNTEEGKEEDALKGEAAMIIGSIARLGRAAGVHLVIATQRPDATLISGETKANLGVRINCGRTDPNASSMILGNSEGARVKANPRGRLYLRIYGNGDHGQGFFASQEWIDEYLDGKGLNLDGTPKNGRQSRLANVADMSQFAEGDLDSREGIDNSAVIDKIRDEEASGSYQAPSSNVSDDEDGDFGFDFDEDDENSDESSQGFISNSEPAKPVPEDKLGRPTLGSGGVDPNKFHRPEEDWDMELENLIRENNK